MNIEEQIALGNIVWGVEHGVIEINDVPEDLRPIVQEILDLRQESSGN